jgi:RimJ/RimL family protein N-acetyltransferase
MLIGKRLRLRAIEKEDLPRFVAWLNDAEVARHLPSRVPLSLTQEEKWYEHILQQQPAEQPLVIERDAPEGWTPIGDIGFHALDWVNRSAELGIFIGEKTSWNQGYGREAIQLLLEYGFNTLNLNRICLRVDETNPGGIHSYEHAGFIHEGRQRQAIFEDGQYIDLLLMSVLRSEWLIRSNS